MWEGEGSLGDVGSWLGWLGWVLVGYGLCLCLEVAWGWTCWMEGRKVLVRNGMENGNGVRQDTHTKVNPDVSLCKSMQLQVNASVAAPDERQLRAG